jgi:hypothetical protein
MSEITFQKCNDCGKAFEEWSCDFCYTKNVIIQLEASANE